MAVVREATVEDAPGVARVQVDTWRAAYAGLIAAEYLASLTYEKAEKAAAWRITSADQPAFSLVAEEDGEIVGIAFGGANRTPQFAFAGELYAIYVLPDHQGTGIGRALLTEADRKLAALGCPSMLLWVLKDNHGARRFYEHMGGKLVEGVNTVTVGGVEYEEVGYGWGEGAVDDSEGQQTAANGG